MSKAIIENVQVIIVWECKIDRERLKNGNIAFGATTDANCEVSFLTFTLRLLISNTSSLPWDDLQVNVKFPITPVALEILISNGIPTSRAPTNFTLSGIISI